MHQRPYTHVAEKVENPTVYCIYINSKQSTFQMLTLAWKLYVKDAMKISLVNTFESIFYTIDDD